MTYRQATAYLDSLINYERQASFAYRRSFKLERMEAFLAAIGRPHQGLRCIHIAGTKGKGSTAAFTAFILRRAGYRIGLYTSPHLSDLRERIRVLAPGRKAGGDFEGMIGRPRLAVLVRDIKPFIERFNRSAKHGRLSFFEVLTALAFEHFRRAKVDFAVLETGLGGRLDATNLVKPLICGITSVSHDHQDKLGSSLASIAGEKAGIIKPAGDTFAGQPLTVISSGQRPEALAVLRRHCRRQKARLAVIGRECIVSQVSCRRQGSTFSLRSPWGSYRRLNVPLAGMHQVFNAALAVSLAAALRGSGWVSFSEKSLHAGLRSAVWPGRLEKIGPVLLDGAHNQASAAALASALRTLFPSRRKVLVLGISKDKDAAAICRQLLPFVWRTVATQADHPRALPCRDICRIIRRLDRRHPVCGCPDFRQACREADRQAGPSGSIVVTGSLFLVAQARRFLYEKIHS